MSESNAPANRGRLIRQTLTIARRDFTATVFTPLFLLFLLSPLIMIAFGVVGGLGGATLARGSNDKVQLIAIATPDQGARLMTADKGLRAIFRRSDAPPPLLVEAPSADPAAQARAAFEGRDVDVSAVLYGPLDRPTILYGAQGARTADYLATLAETALRDQASGAAPLSVATKTSIVRKKASRSGRNQSAFLAVTGIFFLTLFLSGQAVGTMAEERSNKVIEILAAAVPLESVFLGKLIGMFGVAVLFVTFWGTLLSQIGRVLPAGGAILTELAPAVGLPAFVLLFCGYFTMAYMLLGAVFLSVGAQAQTMREIQMLSLPITIVQMAMFGLASAAAADPGSTIATIAEIFPLSSPFAMAARAASKPELWPHLLALVWQALWVAITIWIGAGAFRRGVLKSGSGRKGLMARFARR
jgi:ABC-2 type transport system permease protein